MTKLLRLTLGTSLALSTLGTLCFGQNYQRTNLVSSQGSGGDTDLLNPWGMSRSSGSPWWLADEGTGLSTLYIGDGTKQGLVVNIQGTTAGKNGNPTGTIYNGSATDFLLAKGSPAVFIFATIQGTIAGWNPAIGLTKGQSAPSTHAVTAASGKKGSAYTGLTSAVVDGKAYLYAANLTKGTIDIYDSAFKPATFPVSAWEPEPFTDDLLPPNYVPYNVQAIGDSIVVTYAYLPPKAGFPEAGPGLGYVDIYSKTGYLKTHLDHGDWLNSPWGVALAPTDFGAYSHALLIGEFADGGTTDFSGTIAAYDLTTGHYLGLLETAKGTPLAIQGLWALSPGNVSPSNLDAAASPAAAMYFTAGPKGGSEGQFGYLTAVAAELTEGNDQ
jgi:uncharacterized protein (TIGR03118 family)